MQESDRKFRRNPPGGDDDWHEVVEQALFPPVKIDVIGCFGVEVPVELFGTARQLEWASKDDTGVGNKQLKLQCLDASEPTKGFVELYVQGARPRKRSRIRLHYTLSARCLN